jgi:hypothetical protein
VRAAGGEGRGLAEVVAAARDDVADVAARVVPVAAVARDHVQVQVHHRLAGGLADVGAEVVAVGGEVAVEAVAYDVDEVEQGALLVGGRVEPRRYQAPRDDERVADGDGVAVEDGEGQRVGGDPVELGDGEEGDSTDAG